MTATPPLKIDDEFHDLIPSLSQDEREQLEANLKAHGCRDPLTVWGDDGILLDGHNRQEICSRLGIAFDTKRIELSDRDAAKDWIIRNQFGRRNLQPYQRAELALKLDPLLKAQAKQRQEATSKDAPRDEKGRVKPVTQNSATPEKSRKNQARDELAKIAGCSHDTIHKAKVIAEKADESLKSDLRAGKISINRAFQQVSGKKREPPNAPGPLTKAPRTLPADSATARFT